MTATPSHLSRACLVLNAGAGQVLSAGQERVEEAARAALGGSIRIVMSPPEEIAKQLEEVFASDEFDTVIAGGGDGTVSTAGKLALKSGKTLGVVPLGTMNLFARALGMPQALEAAFHALASAQPAKVDVGEVNGEAFFNHVSVGLHARLVRIRDRMSYAGRISKIFNSIRALRRAAAGAPMRKLAIKVDGQRVRRLKSTLTVVTVNPVPDQAAQLPFRPGQDYGKLGCYMYSRQGMGDIAVLLAELTAGNWSRNENLELLEAETVKLDSARRLHASIDGEVMLMKPPLRCRIRPGALKTLVVPQDTAVVPEIRA